MAEKTDWNPEGVEWDNTSGCPRSVTRDRQLLKNANEQMSISRERIKELETIVRPQLKTLTARETSILSTMACCKLSSVDIGHMMSLLGQNAKEIARAVIRIKEGSRVDNHDSAVLTARALIKDA